MAEATPRSSSRHQPYDWRCPPATSQAAATEATLPGPSFAASHQLSYHVLADSDYDDDASHAESDREEDTQLLEVAHTSDNDASGSGGEAARLPAKSSRSLTTMMIMTATTT